MLDLTLMLMDCFGWQLDKVSLEVEAFIGFKIHVIVDTVLLGANVLNEGVCAQPLKRNAFVSYILDL